MNEQLVVKNFGPIKDATVDFKRVTVFIGPTGGGKSTLAKLAAIFRDNEYYFSFDKKSAIPFYKKYNIDNFFTEATVIERTNSTASVSVIGKDLNLSHNFRNNQLAEAVTLLLININTSLKNNTALLAEQKELQDSFVKSAQANKSDFEEFRVNYSKSILSVKEKIIIEEFITNQNKAQFLSFFNNSDCFYIPAERVFISSINSAWAGLIRDDIGLSKTLLGFANAFLQARDSVITLGIKFLGVRYFVEDGKDYITHPNNANSIRIYEAASGVQSVTPMLVLLEHLNQDTSKSKSFIIEEPELNLFPLAQFELVKILVEKCAHPDGINNLVLTTHSPYVLTALNLLCYAYRVAQQDEATAKKVAKLIPRHCWIDPDQFAAYYVDRPDTKRKQQVRSIINKKTGLIEENELDTASDELGSLFDKLVKLRKPTAPATRAN